jgi:hypothetical protein
MRKLGVQQCVLDISYILKSGITFLASRPSPNHRMQVQPKRLPVKTIVQKLSYCNCRSDVLNVKLNTYINLIQYHTY